MSYAAWKIRDYEKARSLPHGHYDREATKIAVKEEYNKSEKITRKYHKKLHKKWKGINLGEACLLVSQLCTSIGIRPPKKIILNSSHPQGISCAGWYDNQKIHFTSFHISITTLIHELAHHVIRTEKLSGEHDKDFLWILEMLYQLALRKQ